MKKVLKWIGIVLGGLVGLLAVVLLVMYISTELRFNRTYTLPPETVAIPGDAASLERGKRWVKMHCQACHGEDLGGGPFFEDPALGYLDAPNLTSGTGGIGASYTDADWVRALRHGVKLNGKSVFIMPSDSFYYINDNDLGAIIANVRSFAPVDREIRTPSLSPMGKIPYAAGAFGDLLYAEVIPHDVRPPAPPEAVSAEYGSYLSNVHGCTACHGADLAGGQPSEPESPYAPNLTRAGELGGWDEAAFFTLMRTGKTPAGRQVSDFMPWQTMGQMTDAELQAVWLYLQSLEGGG